jgi:hypothetical protein
MPRAREKLGLAGPKSALPCLPLPGPNWAVPLCPCKLPNLKHPPGNRLQVVVDISAHLRPGGRRNPRAAPAAVVHFLWFLTNCAAYEWLAIVGLSLPCP